MSSVILQTGLFKNSSGTASNFSSTKQEKCNQKQALHFWIHFQLQKQEYHTIKEALLLKSSYWIKYPAIHYMYPQTL